MAKGHSKRYDHRLSRFAVTGCEGNVNTEKGRKIENHTFLFLKYIWTSPQDYLAHHLKFSPNTV